jgi:hypothetical protein
MNLLTALEQEQCICVHLNHQSISETMETIHTQCKSTFVNLVLVLLLSTLNLGRTTELLRSVLTLLPCDKTLAPFIIKPT